MMFIELFAPKGALSEEQRRQIAERLVTEVMYEESAPAAVLEAGRAFTQVVVHEPDAWIVGGRPVDPAEPPRYVVRVSVPGSWRKEGSAWLISRVTRVLAEADADPQRLYQEPHAWVHVVGIPEGGCGAFGQVLRSSDITRLITKPYREAPEGSIPTKELAPGMAIDPICGMTVPLTDTAMTLEHKGTIYAFSSPACRAVFAEDQRAVSPGERGRRTRLAAGGQRPG
jgi:YHS domain-containing protein/phenylpyruvate tautomerase PptA (4-oxalocrotonate tautomerase family)